MKKLLFIGRMDSERETARDGVRVKYRVFYTAMQSLFEQTTYVDLDKIARPRTLIRLLYEMIRHRHDNIIVGGGGSSSWCRLVGGLQVLMPSNNKLVFIGTGGNMHRYITANEKNIKVVSRCKAITAEGKEMTRVLKAAGIENVYYVPNFKKISYIPSKPQRSGEKIKFLFFARITPFKGCNLIFDAIDRLKEEGYGERVEVHFYGMMLEEYRKEFEEKIERNKDVATYHGVLNPNGKDIYDELARYDVMLFPTYWSDEGFPGSLVDAFIAGLPVIASDWNQNGEIISNGENGFLVPPRDSVALAEKMKLMIDNPKEYIDNRVKTIQQEALKYDVMHIFSADFMQKLGLCSE